MLKRAGMDGVHGGLINKLSRDQISADAAGVTVDGAIATVKVGRPKVSAVLTKAETST